MNELATQQAGTAVVNPGGNYFQSYGDQVAQKSIVGKLLKFSKGDYLIGQDNEDMPVDTQLVVNMDELMVGWIRWSDGKPSDQIMGRVADGYVPAKRNTLGDEDKEAWEPDADGNPQDPWQFSNYLIMKRPGDNDEDSLFTFTTSSRGGLNAIGELCKTYGKLMRQKPDEFPIVALKVGSYQHSNKAFGRIKFPILEVVGWANKAEFAEALTGEAQPEPENSEPAKKGKGKTRF